jgi:hypothetical protein
MRQVREGSFMKMYLKRVIPALAIFSGIAMAAAAAPPATTGKTYGPTLTSPVTPTRLTAADGFISRWLVLEPIAVNGLTRKEVQPMVKKDYFPDQFTVIPHDGDKETVGDKTLLWHAVDTSLYNVNLYHYANALGKQPVNALFWVVTIVNSPEEMHDVRLAIGSNAASVWWVNGHEVVGIYNDRQAVIDDGVSKRITLKKGPNSVRAAIVNGGGATDFCARFLDSDDKPIKGLSISLKEPGK